MAGTDHTAHDHAGRDHTETVRTDTVRTDGATVTRGTGRDAVAAQHARFGGIKWGAAFFGWLSANGLAVILIAMLSAGGVALGLAQNVDTANEAANKASEIGIGGGIAVLVVLFLAYLAGGYVAGRMARFDGVRQGLAVWLVGLIIVIVLAAAGAILGAKYNVLANLNLPRIPVDEGTATTAGIITLVAILLVTLLGAILGGKLGDRFHRRVDRAGFDTV
jgi:MFS family permease